MDWNKVYTDIKLSGFESILRLYKKLENNTTAQEEKDCHRPMPADRMLKNHTRACRKLALPLQPYAFDDFFRFPTD